MKIKFGDNLCMEESRSIQYAVMYRQHYGGGYRWVLDTKEGEEVIYEDTKYKALEYVSRYGWDLVAVDNVEFILRREV